MKQASADPTFQKWNKQNVDKFGFIPLGPLALPNTDKKCDMGSDPIKLYDVTIEVYFNFFDISST